MGELLEKSKSEIRIGPEMEPKVGKMKRIVKKFLEGKRDYFFEMYKLVPEEERKQIKKYVEDSEEIPDERKKELLFIEESLDRVAEREYKKLKDTLKNMTSIEREEKLKKVKEKADSKRRAAEEIDKEELEMRYLTPEATLKMLFKEMGEDEIKKWENTLLKRLKGIEGLPTRSLKKAIRELELEREELKGLSPDERHKREGINPAKRDYYDSGYTKEERKENVEICEENTKRFERALKEIEAKEEK